MLVTEKVKELSGIPYETTVLIPTKCASCGVELDLNDSLTVLSCPNPFCIEKLIQRAISMCDILDIKDFGESFFRAFFEGTDEQFISNLMLLDDDRCLEYVDSYSGWAYDLDGKPRMSVDSFETNLNKLKSAMQLAVSTLTMPKYLQALSLPNIKSRADVMLKGYQSFKEYYDALTTPAPMSTISKLLGVTENSEQLVILLATSLATYKEDVLNYEKYADFYVPVVGETELKVVCSTAVGYPFKTKRQFYNYVDEKYASLVNVTWSNSATKTCDVLIWSGADGNGDAPTTKVEKICKFNRMGAHIPILTAQAFLEVLDTVSTGVSLRDTLDSLEIEDYTDFM